MKRKVLFLFLAVVLTSPPMIAMAEITVTDPSLTTYSDPALTTYSDPALTTYSDPTTVLGGVKDPPPPPPPPPPPSYSTDIKAYGDQSASHSIGTLTVDSYETGRTNFDNTSNEFKGTNDIMNSGPCVGAGCSFSVQQGDYTSGTGHDWGYTDASTNIDVTNYTASVDMSSFGGMAVCTTDIPAAYGKFNQLQNVSQSVTYPNVGTTSYSGHQTLDLRSKGY